MSNNLSDPILPIKDNLPHLLTSFIGRNSELTRVRQLLQENRLVTLTGTGGVGKTRLALETAALELKTGSFLNTVVLVELAALADPTFILSTLALALNLKEEPDQPLLTTISTFFQTQPWQTLIVLDTCEHLIEACASLAGQLLYRCPNLHILATSRENLNIAGEATFHVPSLTLPLPLTAGPLETNGRTTQTHTATDLEWEKLSQFEAVQLFVDRARTVQPDFQITPLNFRTIYQVCQRLDGIPLAIELAAARLRGLAIEQLASRLNDRFHLLTGGSRNTLPRQQTLQALIDWSHNLLTEQEKVLLRRLAVFIGDFGLEAAEAVCAGDYSLAAGWGRLEPEQVLDLLWQLLNKSLVVLEQPTATATASKAGQAGEARYHLLETIREYSKTRLVEAGQSEVDLTVQRHFNWHLWLAEEAARHQRGPGEMEWYSRLEVEHDNLRAALDWAIKQEKAEGAARLGLSLWKFWQTQTYQQEGYRWLEQILTLSQNKPIPAEMQPQLYNALGTLSYNLKNFEQSNFYQNKAFALWREQGDKAGLATALIEIGWLNFQEMKAEAARQYILEAIVAARATGDSVLIATACFGYSVFADEAGYTEGVVEALEESLAIWRERNDLANIGHALVHRAKIEISQGNYEAAQRYLAEGAPIQINQGHYVFLISLLVPMTFIAVNSPVQPQGYIHSAQVQGAITAHDTSMGGPPSPWNKRSEEFNQFLISKIGEAAFYPEFEKGLKLTLPEILTLAEAIAAPTSKEKPLAISSEPVVYPNGLTEREVEVLKLVAAGYSNPEIAEKLTISRKTGEAHLRTIYAKIEVSSRTAAGRFAYEHSLV